MISFNNRINNNKPHRYQRERTGDRDANAQNAYRQQPQEEEYQDNDLLPNTKEDLNKPISFLDKKQKIKIEDAENTSTLNKNLSLSNELKELIASINSKSQDKENTEYLNALLCDFSKIKDKIKQEEILRLLQSIADRIHTVYFQETLGKQIIHLLNKNPHFLESIIMVFLKLYKRQKFILNKLKYHSMYTPEYSNILSLQEIQSEAIIAFLLNKKDLPMISYTLLENLSILFTHIFSTKNKTQTTQALKALVHLLKHSLHSSTTKKHLKLYLSLFKSFKKTTKNNKTSQSKIGRFLSRIFTPNKPINLINNSIKKILVILKNLHG